MKRKPSINFPIPIRLIKCDNPDTVYEIVKFNNSQNKINAPDFRSGDKVQKRLSKEFNELNVIQYSSRRGGVIDIIKRNPNILPSVTVGQVLAAFHHEPSIAYNEKSKIWESDKLYSDFFNDHTTAKHIIFIYTLLKAIEKVKLELTKKTEPTKNEEDILSFLRSRGAIVLLISAVSNSIEEFLNKRVTNLFDVAFKNANTSIDNGIEHWKPILNIALSFSNHLKGGLTDGIRNQDKVKSCLDSFKQLISAVKNANLITIKSFSDLVST